ncbi:50S ribosomal protein L19 [Mesomycoplasma moatsii]|uniref:50S ribosomal protein L19 n=1 Tax=Mesomycoplasma moatsii TaxID=171287 RepID=UPI0003B33FE0
MISNLMEKVEQKQKRSDLPNFQIGDNVKVHVRIKEGDKSRIQIFEGLVIAKKHSGTRETFTVRKISYGIGVERTFPLHNPNISTIEVIRRNKVRRAKLYYMRDLKGKSARLKELKIKKS